MVGITLSIFINLNISLNILLLWRGVHKGAWSLDVGMLIIIHTSVLWISITLVVLVIWVKSIVSSLADLGEGLSILLLLVLRWRGWSELACFAVNVLIIVHGSISGVAILLLLVL